MLTGESSKPPRGYPACGANTTLTLIYFAGFLSASVVLLSSCKNKLEWNYENRQKDNRRSHNPEVVGSNPTPATMGFSMHNIGKPFPLPPCRA